MREMRAERNQVAGQTWKSVFNEPSNQWSKRKCNIYLHVFVFFICLFAETPKCGIPLAKWLAVQFMFLIFETLIMELRERMNLSHYWDE